MSDVLVSRDRAVEKITNHAEMYKMRKSFAMGAALMTTANAVAAIPGIGWKCVHDEEPLENHKVLGYLDGTFYVCSIFDHDYDGEAQWWSSTWMDKAPTHWMELPAGPEGKDDENT